jgi:hypothetical protein
MAIAEVLMRWGREGWKAQMTKVRAFYKVLHAPPNSSLFNSVPLPCDHTNVCFCEPVQLIHSAGTTR